MSFDNHNIALERWAELKATHQELNLITLDHRTRRTLASNTELDEPQLATLYAESSETNRELAEEGMKEYERGLVSEDAE